tara:strand:- start:233 stop:559 length:327 start_codon:yes stop_codon:yes gene_type:complete
MAFTVFVAATAASVGYQIYSGEKNRRQQQRAVEAQEQANKDANERAKKQADRMDVEVNRANRKRADVAAIQSKEEQSAMTGPAGTMLTGSQGVNPDNLTLGGNTLLGS